MMIFAELGTIMHSIARRFRSLLLYVLEVAAACAACYLLVAQAQGVQSTIDRHHGRWVKSVGTLTSELTELPAGGEAALEAFHRRDCERLRAVEGVETVTPISSFPQLIQPLGDKRQTPASKQHPTADSTRRGVTAWVTLGATSLLDTFDVHVIRGRGFRPDDGRPGTSPVMVANVRLVAAIFPQQNPIGRWVSLPHMGARAKLVGVVDWSKTPIGAPALPYSAAVVWRPRYAHSVGYVLRTRPERLAATLERAKNVMKGAYSQRKLTAQSLEQYFEHAMADSRGLTHVLRSITCFVIVLVMLGTVGLTYLLVARRRHQLGIRRALGATRTQLVRHLLLENTVLTTVGLLFGLPLGYGITRALFDVARLKPLDTIDLIGLVATFWAAGALATLGPAIRASRIPPVAATRML